MKERGQRTGVRKLKGQNKDRQLPNQVLLCENQTGFEELNYYFGNGKQRNKRQTCRTPILPLCQAQLRTALLTPCHLCTYTQCLQGGNEQHGGKVVKDVAVSFCSSCLFMLFLCSRVNPQQISVPLVVCLPCHGTPPSPLTVVFSLFIIIIFVHSSFFCSLIPSSDASPISIFWP